jgi:hypothetical protein
VDNLLPLVGVLFFDWTVLPLLVFYCVEGFLVLSFKSLQLAKTEQKLYKWRVGAWYVVASFLFHLLIMATPILISINMPASKAQNATEYIGDSYFIISVAILAVSIVVTFFQDLAKSKRYKIEVDIIQTHKIYLFLVIKMGLLIGMTAFIAYTGAFSSALIIVICVKAFSDIRSFVRNQITIEVNDVGKTIHSNNIILPG